MNKIEKVLKTQAKLGYWPGFTMAMYPSQFAYDPINVDFEKIWSDRNEVNLYYHIPFCKKICPYCGFFTIAQSDKDYIIKYVDKINEQMKVYSGYFHNKGLIKSICFGGGTPNYAPLEAYYRIFNTLNTINIDLDDKLEPSMEISPELVDEEYILGLNKVGIKRISLGVQSLDLDLRKTINRDNNYNLLQLVEVMRKYDMNINIDVINGIVGQTPKLFMKTLERLMEFKPETISIYPLAGKESSILKKDNNTMTNKEKYDLFRVLHDYLLEEGYYCESNVKFVLKNQTSTHQQKIYEYQGIDTLGLGCAARSYNYHTHYSVEERFNPTMRKSLLDEYISKDFRNLKYYGIHMNEQERKCRFAIYGIFIGCVDMNKYFKQFKSSFKTDFAVHVEAILNLGYVRETQNNELIITKEGRVYTDLICTQFWSDKVKELYKNTDKTGVK
ncbi:radical SAM protein [Anaerosacchariphilus polymeriproducens]|nr:radical SAM protein [Anaerosacchariphilus polymeriproducens]